MSPATARQRIAEMAATEGFAYVRIAPAGLLREARESALAAEAQGRLDGLGWMTPEWLERATDLERFLAGARSVVMVAMAYRPPEPLLDEAPGRRARGRIAAYAAGRDYHRVFEKRLRRMAAAFRTEFGAEARPTVDYGPLLERPLAALAGMGWLGKSTMLLVPGAGPWTLLGAIATTLELPADQPLRKSCGSCERCITACPTGALAPGGGELDARLCISYHTIENRGIIPRELRAKFGDRVFGCDACLDVCPPGWRGFATHPGLGARTPEEAWPVLAELLDLDEEAFAERFRGRPVMRAKRDGMLRNVCVALGNVGTEGDLPALLRALTDSSALVRGHAAWAVGELATRLNMERVVRQPLEDRLAEEHDPFAREELELALASVAPVTHARR